jgi:hypothetical protein
VTASRRDSADRARADAQSGKILEMLTAAGAHGCTNSQLWAVCHAVNSRISDLRKRGHTIEAVSEGGGIWRYRLKPQRELHISSSFEERRRKEYEREAPLFAHGEGRA